MLRAAITTKRKSFQSAQALQTAAAGWVESLAASALSHIQNAMQAPKHGRIHPSGRSSHTASAPGEAPAVDSGDLLGSLTLTLKVEDAGHNPRAEISTALSYAPLLEFGGLYTPARPFLRPGLEAAANEVSALLAEPWLEEGAQR